MSTAHGQVCSKQSTPQTISAGNFDFTDPSLAIDKLTGLRWERCVYGQNWSGTTCVGSPAKLTWEEALRIGEETGKRLPDIKELNTILDLQCIIPPTNLEIFPNTPGSQANGLWSSTPYLSGNSEITNAWYINLGLGFTNYRDVSIKNFVRFIVK